MVSIIQRIDFRYLLFSMTYKLAVRGDKPSPTYGVSRLETIDVRANRSRWMAAGQPIKELF